MLGPMHKWYKYVATVWPLGKSPIIPGTVGTLGGIPLVLLLSHFDNFRYMLFTFIFVIFACAVCIMYERQSEKHDAREIVIDEVAGFLVTMTWVPATWQFMLAGFLLFRFFDGLKPFPINLVDRKIKGGIGVVADDLLAGIFANVILQIIYVNTHWLGLQLHGN